MKPKEAGQIIKITRASRQTQSPEEVQKALVVTGLITIPMTRALDLLADHDSQSNLVVEELRKRTSPAISGARKVSIGRRYISADHTNEVREGEHPGVHIGLQTTNGATLHFNGWGGVREEDEKDLRDTPSASSKGVSHAERTNRIVSGSTTANMVLIDPAGNQQAHLILETHRVRSRQDRLVVVQETTLSDVTAGNPRKGFSIQAQDLTLPEKEGDTIGKMLIEGVTFLCRHLPKIK